MQLIYCTHIFTLSMYIQFEPVGISDRFKFSKLITCCAHDCERHQRHHERHHERHCERHQRHFFHLIYIKSFATSLLLFINQNNYHRPSSFLIPPSLSFSSDINCVLASFLSSIILSFCSMPLLIKTAL